mgnify:CR=1 FL=1
MDGPSPARPSALYAAQRATKSITGDPDQRIVLEELDALHAAVLADRGLSLKLALNLTRRRRPRNRIGGLFLWGGVGRGKTFLMVLLVVIKAVLIPIMIGIPMEIVMLEKKMVILLQVVVAQLVWELEVLFV